MFNNLPTEVISLISQYTGPTSEQSEKYSDMLIHYIQIPTYEVCCLKKQILRPIKVNSYYKHNKNLQSKIIKYFEMINQDCWIGNVQASENEYYLNVWSEGGHDRFIVWYIPETKQYRVILEEYNNENVRCSLIQRMEGMIPYTEEDNSYAIIIDGTNYSTLLLMLTVVLVM